MPSAATCMQAESKPKKPSVLRNLCQACGCLALRPIQLTCDREMLLLAVLLHPLHLHAHSFSLFYPGFIPRRRSTEDTRVQACWLLRRRMRASERKCRVRPVWIVEV
eukprot:2600045-Rhodomonas_salina.2